MYEADPEAYTIECWQPSNVTDGRGVIPTFQYPSVHPQEKLLLAVAVAVAAPAARRSRSSVLAGGKTVLVQSTMKGLLEGGVQPMVYVEEVMWLCGGMWGGMMGPGPTLQKTSTSQPMDGWVSGSARAKGGVARGYLTENEENKKIGIN